MPRLALGKFVCRPANDRCVAEIKAEVIECGKNADSAVNVTHRLHPPLLRREGRIQSRCHLLFLPLM